MPSLYLIGIKYFGQVCCHKYCGSQLNVIVSFVPSSSEISDLVITHYTPPVFEELKFLDKVENLQIPLCTIQIKRNGVNLPS